MSAIQRLAGQGGPQADLGAATSRSLKLRLLEPSGASVSVDGYSAEAQLLEELVTDLWVYRDGQGLFRGRMQPTTRDSLNDKGEYSVATEWRDYRQVLERRIAYADRTWANVEQSTIVWNAITDAQALPGGDLGLTQGTWPATGVIRPSVIIKAGDTVWSFIKTAGQMASGFEFDIDVNLAAHLYYLRRGAASGATLDYGGVVIDFDRTFDTNSYANAVRQSGADGVTPAAQAVPDIASAREGRWDAQYGDTQLTTADMVTQTAAANLARASQPLPVYGLTLAKGAWGGPGHVWLGDYVTVVVRAGRLTERAVARVYELDIDIDSSNEETVTVVAGDVRMDAESVLRGIAKRVQVLSKR